MVKKVQVGDQVVAFPDNMTDLQVKEALRKRFVTPQPDAAAQIAAVQPTTELGRNVSGIALAGLSGATFGFIDEIAGGIAELTGADYRQTRDAVRRRLEGLRERSPKTALASDIAGGIATGGAALRGAAAVAPRLVEAAGTAAGAAGLGAGFGGLTGAGYSGAESVGGLAQDVAAGAVLGGIGGGALQGLGNIVARRLAQRGAPVAGQEAIPLTTGQRTQDAAQQAFEETALKGGYGETARRELQTFREKQDDAIQNTIRNIARPVDEAEAISNVRGLLQRQEQNLSARVKDAYNVAKTEGTGVAVKADVISTGLGDNIKDIVRSEAFDLSAMKDAPRYINELNKLKSGNVSSVKVNAMENWRKKVTNAQADAQRQGRASESALLSRMRKEYDTFLDTLVDSAVVQGNDSAIEAFKQARGLRRDLGKKFDKSRIVSDITRNPDVTNEQAVNMIIGSGNLTGKKQGATIVNDIIRASGKDSQIVKNNLKGAMINRILDRSLTTELRGTQQFVSPAKMSKEISALVDKNKSLSNSVFSAQEVAALKDLGKTVSRISSKRPGVYNNSNTFEKIAVLFNRIPIIGNVPFAGEIFRSMADAKNGKQALRAVGQLKEIVDPIAKQKGLGVAGGIAAERTILNGVER